MTAAFILQVIANGSLSVSMERKSFEGDLFDDIVTAGIEKRHIQCKNSLNHQLDSRDLDGKGRLGKNTITDYERAAEEHRRIDQTRRCIVVTSYRAPADLATAWVESAEVSLLGDFTLRTYRLRRGAGGGSPVEFVFECPTIGATGDEDRVEKIQDTPLFQALSDAWRELLLTVANPLLDDRHTLIAALSLAPHLRATNADALDSHTLAKLMEVGLDDQALRQQSLPIHGARIQPAWAVEVRKLLNEGKSRIHVVGSPGTGKSTSLETIQQQDVVIYRLEYRLDDEVALRRRIDVGFLRHQLSGQFQTTFPEAHLERVVPRASSSLDELNQRLEALATWADQNNRQPCIIVDALDYAARRDPDQALGIVSALAQLNIRPPLSLIVLSRRLPDSLLEALGNFSQVTAKPWSELEIENWLVANGISGDRDRVRRISRVSGGLPVILGHLLREAQLTGPDLVTSLDSLSSRRAAAEGETSAYYDLIWDELSSLAQDAVALVVAHGVPAPWDVLRAAMPGVASVQAIQREAGLTSILDESDGRMRAFHYSFNEHVEGRRKDELRVAHSELFSFYERAARERAQWPEQALYHAQSLDREVDLLKWLHPLQLEQWCKNGVHEDEARRALRQALIVAAAHGDYASAMLAGHMANACQELMAIQAQASARMDYYEACGLREEAITLAKATLREHHGSGDELVQVARLARLASPEIADEHLESWIVRKKTSPTGTVQVQQVPFLSALLATGRIEDFWNQCQAWGAEQPKETAAAAIPLAVRKGGAAFGRQPTLPEWLATDPVGWVGGVSQDIHLLPFEWKQTILGLLTAANKPSTNHATGHAWAMLGRDPKTVLDELSAAPLPRVTSVGFDSGESLPESFYLGRLYGLCGTTGGLEERVRERSADDPDVQVFISLLAALSVPSLPFADVIPSLQRAFVQLSVSPRPPEFGRAWDISRVIGSVARVSVSLIAQGRPAMELTRVLNALEGDTADPRHESLHQVVLDWTQRLNPNPSYLADIRRRVQELRWQPPDEMGPSQTLLDLATDAARQGDRMLAREIFDLCVRQGLRYGHRKDTLLAETWDALMSATDSPIDEARGETIQLLNWARLVHKVTDGKETRHVEGEILSHVLDRYPKLYDEIEKHVKHWTTRSYLLDHAVKVRAPQSDRAWEECLEEAAPRRSGPYESGSRGTLLRLASIAVEKGNQRRAVRALACLSRVEVDSGDLKSQERDHLLRLFHQFQMPVPGWFDKTSPSERPVTRASEGEFSGEDVSNASTLDLKRDLLAMDVRGASDAQYLRYLEELSKRGEGLEGAQIASIIMARTENISKYSAKGFNELAEYVAANDRENAMRHVLNAWVNSPINGKPYAWGVLPQLTWLVRRLNGEQAALEFVRGVMAWLHRLFFPFQYRVQTWGFLAEAGP